MKSKNADKIVLYGCSTEPLSDYLKALGVLRLVAEQKDNTAKGYWNGGIFVLQSTLNSDQLIDFFLKEYIPSPIISPWNGGSGFYFMEGKLEEKDESGRRKKTGKRDQSTKATDAVEKILNSKDKRLEMYRECLKHAKEIVSRLQLDKAPEGTKKFELISQLRSELPDAALRWLDAAVVLTSSEIGYPQFLGTGGNDGNADFSSNFMIKILQVMDDENTGIEKYTSKDWLAASLFNKVVAQLRRDELFGQFSPVSTGGPNAENDFKSKSLVNPWDYLLAFEGALLFSASATRRLAAAMNDASASKPKPFSYPFSVEAIGSGYGTAAPIKNSSRNKMYGEEIRSELWTPIWSNPATPAEIEALFSEGRATFGDRNAKTAIEFAQSVSSLGVDRGLNEFIRYSFIKRNGKNFFAVKLDTFDVNVGNNASLLREPIKWIRRNTSNKDDLAKNNAIKKVNDNLLQLCHEDFKVPATIQETIILLGKFIREASRHSRWQIVPKQILDEMWVEKANDNTPEFRLAVSLAFLLRREVRVYFENKTGRLSDLNNVERCFKFVGTPIRLFDVLLESWIRFKGEEIKRNIYYDDSSIATISDVELFLSGRLDEQRIVDLVFGFMMVKKWPSFRSLRDSQMILTPKRPEKELEERAFPGAGYALAKLCYTDVDFGCGRINISPAISRCLASGNVNKATRLSLSKLRASGLRIPDYGKLEIPSANYARISASLLFPLPKADVMWLARRVAMKDYGK